MIISHQSQKIEMDFNEFALQEAYKKVLRLDDCLQFMKDFINWKMFKKLAAKVLHNKDVEGVRPHIVEIIIVKTLLLHEWYDVSDDEPEFICNDCLNFRKVLGYLDCVLDFTTVWKIWKRLHKSNIHRKIWKELQQ